MKLGRCPICHSHIHLDALIQDDAGSELLGVLAGLGRPLARPLVQYLALFRPAKSDLSNARALRLAQETLALADRDTLTAALANTVRSLHEKRQQGQTQPLKNHNYLRQVLGSTQAVPVSPSDTRPTKQVRQQGRQESTEEANAAWRRQMERLGVDVDELAKRPGGE